MSWNACAPSQNSVPAVTSTIIAASDCLRGKRTSSQAPRSAIGTEGRHVETGRLQGAQSRRRGPCVGRVQAPYGGPGGAQCETDG